MGDCRYPDLSENKERIPQPRSITNRFNSRGCKRGVRFNPTMAGSNYPLETRSSEMNNEFAYDDINIRARNFNQNRSFPKNRPCRGNRKRTFVRNGPQNYFDCSQDNHNDVKPPTSMHQNARNVILNVGYNEDIETNMSNLCLRESMIERLRCGQYSCMICLSSVMPREDIWSCGSCYHVFHLKCITEWALSTKFRKKNEPESAARSADEPVKNSWRCPACQTVHTAKTRPLIYQCFCRKKNRPEYRPGLTSVPHGCDEPCGKSKQPTSSNSNRSDIKNRPICPHACTELCHPGPCPPCVSMVQLSCPCGMVVRSSRCGDKPPEPCQAPCSRLAGRCAFGSHKCPLACHTGDCPPCPKLIKAICYCGRVDEVIRCGSDRATRYNLGGIEPFEDELEECDLEMFYSTEPKEEKPDIKEPKMALFAGTVFSCEKVCDRQLSCKRHHCTDLCHSGDCSPCNLLPENCLTCPCGRVPLSKLVMNGDAYGGRTKCTDAIPVCPNICNRPNAICGHPCPDKCHSGECPPCRLTTNAMCRCRRTTKEMSCCEYAQQVSDLDSVEWLCERICKKKKSCGRHKCKKKCCDMVIHLCQEPCGRQLSCGKHTCEEMCHCGPCGTCWRGVINTELYCHCGATYLSPPQPCGSAPPECVQPCGREHNCDHPVTHCCHSDSECPKCTVLVTKRCPGDHAWMFNVPCFQTVVTCGRRCGKQFNGCSHACIRLCHSGACIPVPASDSPSGVPQPVCMQPCQGVRLECGHACGLPCHEVKGLTCVQMIAKQGSRCATDISLVCSCGRRQENQPCFQVKALARALERKDPSSFLKAQKSQQKKENVQIHDCLPYGLTTNAVLACDEVCAKAKKLKDKVDVKGNAINPWLRGESALAANEDGTAPVIPAPFPRPEYSDWLKKFASSNMVFAADVESILYDLVDQALIPVKLEKPENKCPSHRFIPMKRDKRRFIHELAVFYGVETISFDPEPHTHILALTNRAKAQFPGGGSKQHYQSLSAELQQTFIGSVKIEGGGLQRYQKTTSRLQPFQPPVTKSTSTLLPTASTATTSSSSSAWGSGMAFSAAAVRFPTVD